MVKKEMRLSEFDDWKKYIAERTKKSYWKEKTNVVFGSFPKICPLAVAEKLVGLYPKPMSGLGNGVFTIGEKMYGECKCSLYEQNKDKDCECWYGGSYGRCDCFVVYWNCSMFRSWLKVMEIGITVNNKKVDV